MSNVTPQKVKELRERTQAGFMDCQKALAENNGDIEKAIEWLREKGISKAAKKADAIAAEGITNVVVRDNDCLILEVNSQTDFVAKNDEFKFLVGQIIEAIFKYKKTEKSEVEKLLLSNGKDVKTACIEATAKIGEKIEFRRAFLLTKKDGESFGIYQHSNLRVSAAVLVSGNISVDIGKDVAMHLTAMNPKFMNRESIDKEWLDSERKILLEKSKQEQQNAVKEPKFLDKIIEGRLNKIIIENCLEEQAFIKDNGITIKKLLDNNNAKLIKMVRFELGEGIEKKVEDFASEVAAQMRM